MRRVITIVLAVLAIGVVWRILSSGPRVHSRLVSHAWEPRLGEGGTLRASAGAVEFWREDEAHLVIERAGQHVTLLHGVPGLVVTHREDGLVVAVVDPEVPSRGPFALPTATPLSVLIIDAGGVRELIVPRPTHGSIARVEVVGSQITIEMASDPDMPWLPPWRWPWRDSEFTPNALRPRVGQRRVFVQSADLGETWIPLTDVRAWLHRASSPR